MVEFGEVLWEPSEERVSNSNLALFIDYLNRNFGESFGLDFENPRNNVKNYNDLWGWSVENIEKFWKSIWEFFDIKFCGRYGKILSSHKMPGARWFIGAKLNFAENFFRVKREGEAIVGIREDGERKSISWEKLEMQVSSVANWLREIGIKRGDVVSSCISQVPEGAIALLATASVGAIWCATGAELATRAVIDRLRQLDPKILFAVDGYIYNGKEFSKANAISEIVKSIPSIEKVVIVPNVGTSDLGDLIRNEKFVEWTDIVKEKVKPSFEIMEFNDPLWVLYTSGTTGIPKPIVHSHGGILLEALKSFSLHYDCKPSDRILYPSSPTWMMWQYFLCGLLIGCTVVLYDGSPVYRDFLPLWEIAEKEKLTLLGLGAPFIRECMKRNIDVKTQLDLGNLKMIFTTAAPLSPDGFKWVYEGVKDDLWLGSGSGGTDVFTGFLQPCPILPVWAGEIQCRALGVAVDCYDPDGKSVVNEVGELVVTRPMPSMPIYFWGDSNFEWYEKSYFDMYPSVWRHGDWVKITERGSAIVYGRSDSTIKRKGVRMGTLEIYKVVEAIPEVKNSLAIEVEGNLILFVVTESELTESIKNKIFREMRENLGPYFIPDYVVRVPDIPITLNYKKLEVPVKRILYGWKISKAVNLDSLLNPDSLRKLVEIAKPIAEDILKQIG